MVSMEVAAKEQNGHPAKRKNNDRNIEIGIMV
jgi:hypothetical protein